MKDQRTGKASVKGGTDWERLASLTEKQIRRGLEADPEVRATDPAFWKKAEVKLPKPSRQSPYG